MTKNNNVKKYYYVPLTSMYLQVDGITFHDLLEELAPLLIKREEIRTKISYGDNNHPSIHLSKKRKEIIEEFNRETTILYHQKHIPEKVLIVSDEKTTREFATNKIIKPRFDTYLDVFRISEEEANKILVEYFEYLHDINEVFNKIPKKEKTLTYHK